MSVVRRIIKGEKYWVIDRSFRRPDGSVERYRRVSQVQTRPAAEAEERRICDHWSEHGTISALTDRAQQRSAKPAKKGSADPVWEDAVAHFVAVVLPKKKPSTRKGYQALLGAPGMTRWAGKPLDQITRAAITKWDTHLCEKGVAESTRRNHHIVLRSVLRAVGPIDDEAGLLLKVLPGFPRLPKVGEKAAQAVDPQDVEKLLWEVDDEFRQPVWTARRRKARLAFALAAIAGLRASEIRGLRRQDVDLRRGLITVRIARVGGQEATPKSGHEREIPIAPQLMPALKRACEHLKPEAYVATSHEGEPWSDTGIWAALRRATKRLGLTKAKVHGLRHHFATALFDGKTDARTVQKLLGHHSLEVTQRYASTNRDRARVAIEVFGGNR